MSESKYTSNRPFWTGSTLTVSFSRWLIVYLLVVIVFWIVGIEAIYGHVTPFYALLYPVFPSLFVFFGVLFMFGVLYWILRLFVMNTHGIPRGWEWLGLVFWILCALLAVIQALNIFQHNSDDGGITLGSQLISFCYHALVLVLFGVFFTLWKTGLRLSNWFDNEPSKRSVAWFLTGIIFFSILFSCSVAMLRNGPDAIAAPYGQNRQTMEYIGDIGKGGSIHGLFKGYNNMHPYLSMHAKVHPPGPIVILWVLSFVTASREPVALALATIVFGSLSIIPLYFWIGDMTNRRTALTACMLYALMPAIVLFTATSADITFMPFTLTTLFLFWRALHKRSILYALAAGIGYAIMSLTSFSLISIGAFFGFVGLWRLFDKQYTMSVFQTAALMLFAFLAVHTAVWLWSGFDVVECFRLCKTQFDTDQFWVDQHEPRYPWWAWKVFNPLCWVYYVGIPVSVLFFRSITKPDQKTKGMAIVIVLTLFVLNLLYLARGEGERSAMYIFPFVLIPAAFLLNKTAEEQRSPGVYVAVFSFLFFQCWLTESFLYTYW